MTRSISRGTNLRLATNVRCNEDAGKLQTLLLDANVALVSKTVGPGHRGPAVAWAECMTMRVARSVNRLHAAPPSAAVGPGVTDHDPAGVVGAEAHSLRTTPTDLGCALRRRPRRLDGAVRSGRLLVCKHEERSHAWCAVQGLPGHGRLTQPCPAQFVLPMLQRPPPCAQHCGAAGKASPCLCASPAT